MQAKLKYKLFGEFDNYEVAEIAEWIGETLKNSNMNKLGTLKITIDYEPEHA